MRKAIYRFVLPRHLAMTSNDRLHPMERARRTSALRGLAAQRILSQPLRMERARCVYTLQFPDRRRRDPANWYPTVKALVDGLVTGPDPRLPFAGLLPDDDSKHLVGPDPRLSDDKCERGLVVVTLSFEELEATANINKTPGKDEKWAQKTS